MQKKCEQLGFVWIHVIAYFSWEQIGRTIVVLSWPGTVGKFEMRNTTIFCIVQIALEENIALPSSVPSVRWKHRFRSPVHFNIRDLWVKPHFYREHKKQNHWGLRLDVISQSISRYRTATKLKLHVCSDHGWRFCVMHQDRSGLQYRNTHHPIEVHE